MTDSLGTNIQPLSGQDEPWLRFPLSHKIYISAWVFIKTLSGRYTRQRASVDGWLNNYSIRSLAIYLFCRIINYIELSFIFDPSILSKALQYHWVILFSILFAMQIIEWKDSFWVWIVFQISKMHERTDR